jgi:periplasmic protein TonB
MNATNPGHYRFTAALLASFVVHGAAMMVSLPVAKIIRPVEPSILQVRVAAPQEPAGVQSASSGSATSELPVRRAPRPRTVGKPAMAETAPSPPPPPALSEVSIEVPTAVLPPHTEPDVAAQEPLAGTTPPVLKEATSDSLSRQLLETYGRQISQALGRHKEYPRTAQIRGWQGSVTMRLRVARSGRVIDAELYGSSGHDVLDKEALAMARKAEQLPVPPDSLRDSEIVVLVPIVFRLEQ